MGKRAFSFSKRMCYYYIVETIREKRGGKLEKAKYMCSKEIGRMAGKTKNVKYICSKDLGRMEKLRATYESE